MDYLKLKINMLKENMEEIGLYDGFGQVFIDCMISVLFVCILLFCIIKDIYIQPWSSYIESAYFYIFLGSFIFFVTYIALGIEKISQAKRMCLIFAPAMLFFEFVLLENWYEMGLVLLITMIITIMYLFITNIRHKIMKSTSLYSGCVAIFNMLGDVILSVFVIGLIAFTMNSAFNFYQMADKAIQENNHQNIYIVEEVQDERI